MKKAPKLQDMTGTVKAFNISPKGFYEGVLIETDGETVQVNFDPEAGAYLSAHFPEGKTIALAAELQPDSDKGPSAHPVYWLISFKDAKQKTIRLDEDGQQRVTTSGKIKCLNYALHGEVNGAVLDNGDFLHLKPKGAKAVGLEVGDTITAEGEARLSLLANRVIEADTVNGQTLHDKPKRKSA